MSTAGEAKPSQGRLRARGVAKALRARPSARPARDTQHLVQASSDEEREPKGPTPSGLREADAPTLRMALLARGGRE
jgi:hypothetical protein